MKLPQTSFLILTSSKLSHHIFFLIYTNILTHIYTYKRYLREYQALGTAGGIYHFRDEIIRGNPQQFFVMHVDIACTFPLKEMAAFHQGHRGLCTMLSTKVKI